MSRRGRRVPWIAVLVALVGFAFIALPLIGLTAVGIIAVCVIVGLLTGPQ